MWTHSFDSDDSAKRVNLFGIGKPFEGQGVSITGQINFPFTGINRKIAGVFAVDEDKNILILHSGKIGGGKPGIGKKLFLNNFRGDFITANDGDRDSQFCFVGELESHLLPIQIADFIEEIARIKMLEETQNNTDFEFQSNFNYTDEHTGKIVTERNDPIVINRIHGLVVKALSRKLETIDYTIGNDKNRDLFIHKNNIIKALFEIKTNSSTQSLYSAVGQLIIYSIPIKNKINLFAVLPTKLSKLVENKLRSLSIIPLYYKWLEDEIEFINIDKLLQKL
jgi:hypothetical protein